MMAPYEGHPQRCSKATIRIFWETGEVNTSFDELSPADHAGLAKGIQELTDCLDANLAGQVLRYIEDRLRTDIPVTPSQHE